ncbi:DNA polymerase eta isoform X3 [Ziziphus jujuba]|uniref:DNA polymerase eta n=1 Tax=Ziziphus jujuba TaxID=326968 RepID=A0A6P6FTZ6_ZIZJJ|nr:DNA polymerase eta isoform X3 [Ziziphus jujuba]
MPVAKPESSDSRIIAHIDMDCFYVQVEQRKHPELRGLPTAVVQYNEWKGGSLIAVGYEARKYGVKRSMRGDEAKRVCQEIQLVRVPVARGKADLNTYRNAGSEVVSILARKGRCERASIDEVYLDLTEAAETLLAQAPPENMEVVDEEALKSHVLGLDDESGGDTKGNVRKWLCSSDSDRRDKLLACGALIVAELRMQVLKETEFTCSAGIAHNKMLAKLASGMNKPAQQTVVPLSSVEGVLDSLPIKKMKQLGGKLGSSLQTDLGVFTVGDLLQFSEEKLQERYGFNTGTWLWNIARGINGEEVQGRLLTKSHGSGKTFPGPRALKTIASVQHWLNELCSELSERLYSDLDQNKRIARTLTLYATAYKSSDSDSQKNFPSKSCPLRYGCAKIQEDALNLFQAALREYSGPQRAKTQGSRNHGWGITGLSISASKIVSIPAGTCSIMKYFHGQDPPGSSSKQSQNDHIEEAAPLSPSGSGSYSEMNSAEKLIEFTGEDVKLEYEMPYLDQQEHRKDFSEDQNSCCLSTKQARDDLTQGTFPSSEVNQSQRQRVIPVKGSGISSAVSSPKKLKQKRNKLKDKGGYSILRFFKNNDPSCSSQKREHVENIEVKAASSSAGFQFIGSDCLKLNEAELPKENPVEEQRREAWSYNVDEIDPSVIDELPPEIQDEVRALLRPQKRPNNNIVKRGSSICHYFLPARNA